MQGCTTDLISVNLNPAKTLAVPVEKRTFLVKIAHRIEMIFKTIRIIFIIFQDILQNLWKGEKFLTVENNEQNGTFYYPTSHLPWNTDRLYKSEGLNLCIHGLNCSPLYWIRYSEQMKREHSKMDTVTPHVALKGNCTIETAAQPLLAIVEDYLKKNPGKPVNLIGTSNGGRIATYIESHLEPSLLEGAALTVTSIAGVHYGTRVIDLLKKLGLLRFTNFNSDLVKEFEWGSETAQKLHNEWRNKQLIWNQNKCNVRHLFCASTEDEQVKNNSSSLPLPPSGLSGNENLVFEHKIYHGESHLSIVENAQKDVMNWIFKKRWGQA